MDNVRLRQCIALAAMLRDCLRPLQDDLTAPPDGPAIMRARLIVGQANWMLLDMEEALTAIALPEDGGNTWPP